MTPATCSRVLQFCAGPEQHRFYACEEHRAELEQGDVSCFFGYKKDLVEPVDPDDEIECDLCREG